MIVVVGIVVILAGIGVMGFGLLLFYAFLPLFYGLLGAGVGYWIGFALSGSDVGSPGLVEIIGALIGAIVFAAAAYGLEGARRVLTGLFLGALVGLALGAFLGAGNVIMFILAVVFAIGGAIVLPFAFDPLIIISSAIAGAAMIMDGARLILPDLTLVDRTLIPGGAFVPVLVWIVLAAIGLGWQFSNLSKWVRHPETVAG